VEVKKRSESLEVAIATLQAQVVEKDDVIARMGEAARSGRENFQHVVDRLQSEILAGQQRFKEVAKEVAESRARESLASAES
jgi:uncharacterized coiled-coil protein SlyX